MKERFYSFLANFSVLTGEQKQLLDAVLIEKAIPKKTIVIEEGAVADSFYFLVEGAFRSYLLKDGEDVTDYFFFENSFASDYASLYAQKPSVFYLEALENSQVVQIRRKDLLALAQQDQLFAAFGRVQAEMAFVEIEERMRLLHHESLETRFRWMMNKFPQVFQRVPQYHIASYLGVKPESLSRIKKTIGTSI
jgi:CRP-like cAMP-binding protein